MKNCIKMLNPSGRGILVPFTVYNFFQETFQNFVCDQFSVPEFAGFILIIFRKKKIAINPLTAGGWGFKALVESSAKNASFILLAPLYGK